MQDLSPRRQGPTGLEREAIKHPNSPRGSPEDVANGSQMLVGQPVHLERAEAIRSGRPADSDSLDEFLGRQVRQVEARTEFCTGALHGRHAFSQLVDQRCVDVVQPDLKWCGGLSEAVKIYTIAETAGLVTIPIMLAILLHFTCSEHEPTFKHSII